ncbi:MAG: hypothetical protein IPK07_17340 [Deltaproteobacteria bacterium]|nr:hypothetical protein [Deltaproteobacteria bacterium]
MAWGRRLPRNATDVRGEIDKLWEKRRLALAAQQPSADSLLDRIYDLALGSGQHELPVLAAALLREAARDVARHDLEQADARVQAARRLAPELPQTRFARADVLLRSGPAQWNEAVRELSEGTEVLQTSLAERARFQATGLFYGLLCGLAVAIAFPLLVVIRHRRRLTHAVEHRLPSWWSRSLLVAVWLPVFAGALRLRLGLGWLALALLVAVWLAGHTRERVVGALLGVLVACGPWGVTALAERISVHRLALEDPVVRAQTESYSAELVEALIAEVKAKGETVEPLAALALLAKRAGHLDFAEAAWRRVAALETDAAWVHNNLGIVLFHQGQEQESMAEFRRAIELDPELAEAHLNESQVLRQNFVLMPSQDAFARAQAIDPLRVNAFHVTSARGLNRFLLDAPLPRERLEARLQVEPAARARSADAMWGSLVRGLPRVAFPVLVGMVAIVTVLAIRRSRSALGPVPPACTRCGAPFCVVCGVRAAMGAECEACLSLALGNPILDPVFKQERRETVERERAKLRWTARAAGLLVPGGGHVLLGSSLTGFAVLAVATALLLVLVFGSGIVLPTAAVWSGPSALGARVQITALAVLWLVTNLHLFVASGRDSRG